MDNRIETLINAIVIQIRNTNDEDERKFLLELIFIIMYEITANIESNDVYIDTNNENNINILNTINR